MHIPRAATRRWLVVLLLVVATVAAPVTGSAKAQKAIVVSISQQMLWAYKGDEVVLNSYVSTGRPDFDTPIGSFAVLTKLPSQTMEGVIGGEYYNVPDVPWVLYFTNRARPARHLLARQLRDAHEPRLCQSAARRRRLVI